MTAVGAMDGFELLTERLRLRPYRPEDLDDLAAMFGDPEHMRFYPSAFDRATTQAWLDRQSERYEREGYGLWLAEERSNGGFVGTIGPAPQEVEGESLLEIGWHVRPGLKGLGYAPEGAAAARDWVFANLEVDHVISLILPENTPSARVAEKLGMRIEREADYKGLLHRVYRIDRGAGLLVPFRRADAPELPVAAERGRDHLFGPARLRADVLADRDVALDDRVAERSEALDLHLDHVAGLDRTGVGGRAREDHVAGDSVIVRAMSATR